jgi:Condensation domain
VGQMEFAEPRLLTRVRRDRAPLTFSQIAHWNEQRLGARHVLRGVASATRLIGRLNVGVLRRCITEMVRRHEALRTRIVLEDGILVQKIDEARDYDLTVHDLSRLAVASRELEVKRLIGKHMDELIDVAVDSLFGAWLLRLAEEEHVIILAMEHSISDGVSRNILVRDIFRAYGQLSGGHSIDLSPISLQLSDFAVWQQNTQESWLERHGPYWNEHLAGCSRVTFPKEEKIAVPNTSGLGAVQFNIEGTLLAHLREWCRSRHTTLPMGVLTAYAGFVLRWCDSSEVVIQYETDGRFSQSIRDTIGYFAFPLYLKVVLRDDDTFSDLTKRITAEYCNAYEHADFAYIKANTPDAGFIKNTMFNWGTQGPSTSTFELDGPEGLITGTLVPLERDLCENYEMDEEPGIALLESEDHIWGGITFPLNGFSFEMMREFSAEFIRFLQELLDQPDRRVKASRIRRSR